MNKLLTPVTILTLIAFTMSSCTKDNKGYLPLEIVNVYPFEELTTQGRNLKLVFYTEKEYPCLNHVIRYTNSTTTGNFDITLVDIEKQSLCLEESGPAKAVISFGNLMSGNFPLKIMVADSVNEGTIEISSNRYVINIAGPKMLQVKYDTLMRIPDHTVWGVAAFNDSTGFPVKEMFLDSLEVKGAVADTLVQGNFGYFSTDANGKIIIDDNGGWNYLEPFVYQYSDDWTEIVETVRDFAFLYPGDVFIYIYNYKGEACLTSYFY